MKYTDKNKPVECMMTQSTCYRKTRTMEIKGILWHSTGANNPEIRRYVQPDDGAPNRTELLKLIGKNEYGNDWNHTEVDIGLNAWVGKLADGTVGTVQTMPWNYRPWGCASGKNGSCNNGWIQFEICEDSTNNATYAKQVVEEAAQLTAYLCKKFNLNPKGTTKYNGINVPVILCHQDSYRLGLGSDHADVLHWFPKFGINMDTIRNRVAEILGEDKPAPAPAPTPAPAPAPSTNIKVGSLCSIASDATYYNGSSIPKWVKSQNWYVKELSGDRAVINENEEKTNEIMSPINVKYLKAVEGGKGPDVFKAYTVKVTARTGLNYRTGPGTNYPINGVITDNGVYTIVDEAADSNGNKWGKLKSGAGWIMLKFTKRV